MKVLIDDKIPYIKGILENLPSEEPLKVQYLPGREIRREHVKNADALIIRTRTRCNAALLEGSRIRFIATATIGYDHIDTDYCAAHGIQWTNAPGCNSGSVAQYMESVFYLLSRRLKRPFPETTLGIVGVGHVGAKVERVARSLGMNVLLCDPPRVEKEGLTGFCSLDELAAKCHLLSFHTPLVREGIHATYHLADQSVLNRMPAGSCVINTSRGEVVDTQALYTLLHRNHLAEAVIDVWENEPHPLPELLEKVFIGTPHIAGYSADGKVNATRMSVESFCRFFGIPATFHLEPPAPSNAVIPCTDPYEVTLSIYDPRRDSQALKTHPEQFEWLRENYPLRREKEAYTYRLEQ